MTILVPMSEVEYAAYIEDAIPGYAHEKVASGQWPEYASLEMARKEFEKLLPQGLATPNNFLYEIRAQDAPASVGMLWFAIQDRSGKRVAYVYDVLIKPEYWRKGHATRAFGAFEEIVQAMGLSGIALHVFGRNTQALALYLKLGYRPTNINLFKHIGH